MDITEFVTVYNDIFSDCIDRGALRFCQEKGPSMQETARRQAGAAERLKRLSDRARALGLPAWNDFISAARNRPGHDPARTRRPAARLVLRPGKQTETSNPTEKTTEL